MVPPVSVLQVFEGLLKFCELDVEGVQGFFDFFGVASVEAGQQAF